MTPSERETCFRALADSNHARWVGVARCYAVESERDDLLQEIMLQVWKSLDCYQGRSSIDTWAYRIALNTGLAWGRSARRRRLRTNCVEVEAKAQRPEGNACEVRVLDDFLRSLPKADRAVMLLFLDDVPGAEAAEIMGISDGALRVRLHRIRKRFAAEFLMQERGHDV